MGKSLIMKNRKSFVLYATTFLLIACTQNTPIDYTSIKGSWRCIESSQSGDRSYLIDIYKKKNETNTYLISNFHRVGYDAINDIIVVVDGNKISFATQALGASLQLKAGTGTIDADMKQMTINYQVTDGATYISYTAQLSR